MLTWRGSSPMLVFQRLGLLYLQIPIYLPGAYLTALPCRSTFAPALIMPYLRNVVVRCASECCTAFATGDRHDVAQGYSSRWSGIQGFYNITSEPLSRSWELELDQRRAYILRLYVAIGWGCSAAESKPKDERIHLGDHKYRTLQGRITGLTRQLFRFYGVPCGGRGP